MTFFSSICRAAKLIAAGLALQTTLASAQSIGQPLASIAVPSDTPYVGTIALDVDLTDLDRRIMDVRETLPVKPGALTLLYPRWLPGSHSPAGSVTRMAGLQITANGKPVAWTRDTLDVYAFHLHVPDGVSTLNIAFQHLSPVAPAAGRVVMTQEIIGLQWNTVVLYPAGHYASAIQTQVSAKLPHGWQTASALDIASREGDHIAFKSTSLERLVDSPLWAGKYTRRFELDPTHKAPVYLTVFADSPASLEAAPEHIAAHKQLVR